MTAYPWRGTKAPLIALLRLNSERHMSTLLRHVGEQLSHVEGIKAAALSNVPALKARPMLPWPRATYSSGPTGEFDALDPEKAKFALACRYRELVSFLFTDYTVFGK